MIGLMMTHPDCHDESQLLLLLDDDQMITDSLAAGLEREGRTLISCNDVESAQLIVDRFRPSHIVADIRISSPFGCDGLDFLRYARRHAPESRVILMSGDAPPAMQLEASERGAVAFLQKPFAIDELDALVNVISSSPLSTSGEDGPRHIRVPMMDEILSSGALHPLVQPIVALDGSGSTFGYESLARFHSDSPLRNPEVLFQYAKKKERVGQLEHACLHATLAIAALLPEQSVIFINVHPDAFDNSEVLANLVLDRAQREGIALDRIVLEITEQGSFPAGRAVMASVERLREAGVRFAFDDVGVAYSHLPLIGKLRPSFLKISQDFGTRFERDGVKSRIVSNIVSLASDFGCDVILEGIEDQSTADAARNIGVRYGQGFLFGRPVDPSAIRSMVDQLTPFSEVA